MAVQNHSRGRLRFPLLRRPSRHSASAEKSGIFICTLNTCLRPLRFSTWDRQSEFTQLLLHCRFRQRLPSRNSKSSKMHGIQTASRQCPRTQMEEHVLCLCVGDEMYPAEHAREVRGLVIFQFILVFAVFACAVKSIGLYSVLFISPAKNRQCARGRSLPVSSRGKPDFVDNEQQEL